MIGMENYIKHKMKIGDYLYKEQVEFHIKYYMIEYKFTRKKAQDFLKTYLGDCLDHNEENIRDNAPEIVNKFERQT